MLIKFNLSIQEKFYEFLDYLNCSHKGICKYHRTPLDLFGDRVFCPKCDDEKLQKKIEKENNNEK